jgi:hypothetical protein
MIPRNVQLVKISHARRTATREIGSRLDILIVPAREMVTGYESSMKDLR